MIFKLYILNDQLTKRSSMVAGKTECTYRVALVEFLCSHQLDIHVSTLRLSATFYQLLQNLLEKILMDTKISNNILILHFLCKLS